MEFSPSTEQQMAKLGATNTKETTSCILRISWPKHHNGITNETSCYAKSLLLDAKSPEKAGYTVSFV